MAKRPGRKLSKDPLLLRKEFVERLARGYGITEACKDLSISRQTIYNWRKKDEGFNAEVERVLADPIHQTRILRGNAKSEIPTEADWKLRFIGIYRRTGKRNEALMSLEGKGAIFIENALNPMHEDFDTEFADMFAEEQQRKLWTIEDNTMVKAEHDAPTARFVLSNLMKDKYGKVEGGTNVNQFWFTLHGEKDAVNELARLNFGQAELGPPSDPVAALPSGVGDNT